MSRTDGKIETMPAGTPAKVFALDSSDLPILATRGLLPGTLTNDSASAGMIGEYIESIVALGSAVSLTTATDANITSISLTAGDWDVSAMAGFFGNAATNVATLEASVSLVSNARDSTSGRANTFIVGNGTGALIYGQGQPMVLPISPLRFSVAVTTPIYLVARSSFTLNTNIAYGLLRARRVR